MLTTKQKLYALFHCFGLLIGCQETQPEQKVTAVEKPQPIYLYGIDTNLFHVRKDTIKEGDSFGKIFNKYNISLSEINQFAAQKDTFAPMNKLRKGEIFTLFFDKNKTDSLAYAVYEPNITHFLRLNFNKGISLEKIERPITTKEKEVGGYIQNSLILDMINAGASFNASYQFSQIFDYTVDFFHLQKNDVFRLIYQEKFVDDSIPTGQVQIKAAYMQHKGNELYGFFYTTDSLQNKGGFYDEQGRTMKRMFLKAPLDIFRITSRFGIRFHPILHRIKGHFGTDYAAPHGTPIRATASGTIVETGYNSGNGKYVKIKHNKVYDTHYLHMSEIIAKKGQYVAQGDIIGKVGSTGLATGPHVCYRFWKNGKPVDPLKEVMPNTEPIEEKHKEKYFAYIKPLKEQLEKITLSAATQEDNLQTDSIATYSHKDSTGEKQ